MFDQNNANQNNKFNSLYEYRTNTCHRMDPFRNNNTFHPLSCDDFSF